MTDTQTTTTWELLAPPTTDEDEPSGVLATTTSIRVAKRWEQSNGPRTTREATR